MDKCTPHSFKWERARHPTVISQKIKSRQIHTSVSSYRRVRAQRQLEIYPRGLSWKRMGIVFWTYLRLFLCLADKKKEKKMRRAAGWHMRSIFLLLCSGRVSKLSTQGCSFFFFFCHTSLRCSEMNTDGYNRALGSVCDWCLIPEVGQNHSRPNHSFLSALVKHEVSEERGFFFVVLLPHYSIFELYLS